MSCGRRTVRHLLREPSVANKANIQQRFRTVLVPVDLGEATTAALDRAAALPLATDAKIEIVHILSDVPTKAKTKVEAAAREGLARSERQARALVPEAEISSKLLRGQPHIEIIRRARSIEAELIVIGRHAQRPIRDKLIGTTAARIVRMGETPVLVVHHDTHVPYRRPLVATDLTDTFRMLVELALRTVGRHAAVTVAHAVHIPFEGFLASTATARAKLHRAAEEEAMTKLERRLDEYREWARWRTRVRCGDPRLVIMSEAVQSRADVIVIGTHARSGLAHAVIGSAAEWTLANAPCDVVVARPMRFAFELP